MLETKKLRDVYEEAARSFEQINAWQKEQEAKEEKLRLLIREKNRKERQEKNSKFGGN
ncbi:MAG TPA: hypothetical protein VF556_15540 [Pyrinomonadaceae bacterium]|jgi:hypothetical protein